MARPRSIGIDMVQGESKNVTFTFSDEPDLTAAQITIYVKRHVTDTTYCIEKQPDINLSPNLETGECVFRFTPDDTEDLDPRTYKYEMVIYYPDTDETYKPIYGDFKLWDTLS